MDYMRLSDQPKNAITADVNKKCYFQKISGLAKSSDLRQYHSYVVCHVMRLKSEFGLIVVI